MPTIDRISFSSIVGNAHPTKIAVNGIGARFKVTTRIISLRKALTHERKRYEQYLKNRLV
jgi:uncharacterized DUF497 family protein